MTTPINKTHINCHIFGMYANFRLNIIQNEPIFYMTTISAHHAIGSLAGAARQGHCPDELLKKAGINPRLAALPSARVNDNQMTLLVQLISKLLGDEFMGFTETPCKPGACRT